MSVPDLLNNPWRYVIWLRLIKIADQHFLIVIARESCQENAVQSIYNICRAKEYLLKIIDIIFD